MNFEILDRGFSGFLVLLAGWGFCPKIFSRLNLPYGYIVPSGPVCFDISSELHDFLMSSGIGRVSILGWSMGAYVADSFRNRWPSMVERCFLVSTREIFPAAEIAEEERSLREDREGTLTLFYKRCFLGQRNDYRWFQQALEAEHLRTWDLEKLLAGLDYLKSCRMDLSRSSGEGLHVFHGERDVIAPLSETPPLPAGVELSVVRGAGHLPFLCREFEEAVVDL